MFVQELTPRQKLMIIEATKVKLDTLIKLHVEGHADFDEMLEEYPDIEADEIQLEILEQVITFEELQNEPERIWSLSAHSLLVMQFIIMQKLPTFEPYPNAKKSLVDKIQTTINQIRGINLN